MELTRSTVPGFSSGLRRTVHSVFADSSCLTGLSGTPAFCLTWGPGDRRECRPLSSSYITFSRHFNLRDIKRLSGTHTLVLRFAFGFGTRYSGLAFHGFLELLADSHNPALLRAAYYSWRRARIPLRSLPANAMRSRNP